MAIIFLHSSCVTQRKVEYLQHKGSETNNFPNSKFQDYKLKPNDELYIQISSLDDASATIFTNSGKENLGNLNPYGASLMSYTINKDGFVELPVIGSVKATEMTISELTGIIKQALSNVLNQPVISVKLVNRYVSILGEVKNPGHYPFSQEKLSIFDAIGLAGDITDYGNRGNVILLRNIDNINTRIELNLLKSETLSSEYYFLRPNDVLYVKPLKSKFWGLRQFPFSIVLSSITTAILVLNYTNN